MRFPTLCLLVAGLLIVAMIDTGPTTAGDFKTADEVLVIEEPAEVNAVRTRTVMVQRGSIAEAVCGPNGCEVQGVLSRVVSRPNQPVRSFLKRLRSRSYRRDVSVTLGCSK